MTRFTQEDIDALERAIGAVYSEMAEYNVSTEEDAESHKLIEQLEDLKNRLNPVVAWGVATDGTVLEVRGFLNG